MKFLEESGIPLDTDDVNTIHIRNYMQSLATAGRSPRTIMRRVACLRSFFTFACRYHDLPSNPVAAVVYPKLPETLPDLLTHTEVARMIEASEENHFRLYRVRDRCILAVLACLGIRRQELIDLSLRDWEESRSELRIRSGKGFCDRVLPVPPELARFIADWLKIRPETTVDNLFLSRNGRPLSSQSLQRMLRRAAAAAGLEDVPHLHMFRHYAATAIVANHSSGGLEQARRILGHASNATVSIYAHLSVDDLRPVVRDNAILSGIAPAGEPGDAKATLEHGTEITLDELLRVLGSLPDGWQREAECRDWLAVEWTRHCIADTVVSYAFADVAAMVCDRRTVPELALDVHLAATEFAHVAVRRLTAKHRHCVADLVDVGEDLARGPSGQLARGEGLSRAHLSRLEKLLPADSVGAVGVIEGLAAVASELRGLRVDVPGGRVAIELLLGLIAWGRGLPPLIIPASDRSLWRLLLHRHAGGDPGLAVAYCVARLTDVASGLLAALSVRLKGGDQ